MTIVDRRVLSLDVFYAPCNNLLPLLGLLPLPPVPLLAAPLLMLRPVLQLTLFVAVPIYKHCTHMYICVFRDGWVGGNGTLTLKRKDG